MGRCGDYVLRDRKDVLRIFVYAPKEWRLAYGKENNMLQAKDEKGIKDEIDKTDRNRAAYYNYYTQNRWGDAHNYDLAINAALGHDACVNMILAAAEAKEKTMEADARRPGWGKINNDAAWVGAFALCPRLRHRRTLHPQVINIKRRNRGKQTALILSRR